MKKLVLVGVAVSALVPASAMAQTPTHQHVIQYKRAYQQVRSKFGRRAPGCYLFRTCHLHGRITDADVMKSLGVLDRMLIPAPTFSATNTPTPITSSAPSYNYTGAYASGGGGGCGGDTPYPGGGQCWAIPWGIVKCESGGQNVPNTQGSGANGYYQLMVGGTGSRAQQDALASALWANGAGAHNWTCKG